MSISVSGFEKTFQYAQMFKEGMLCTVYLSLFTVILGFMLALVLAVMRMSNFRPLRFLAMTPDGHMREEGFVAFVSRFNPISFVATVYVEVIRATPMLVQLFIVYQVVFSKDVINLPSVTILGFLKLNRFLPGVVALALNSGAYLSEIIRAGIQSVDGGQTEAARSLGLGQGQTMRFIVLPQAIKNILPSIANEFVTIIKESSVCAYVGMYEIMYSTQIVQGATFIIIEPLIVASVLYFCLTFPTSKVIGYFERRMSRGDKR